MGGSFGSQWAFAVMRLHPERVARAMLAGVEPLDAGLDMPSQHLATLARIAADADRDPALLPYLPEGGLMAAVDALRARFARGPITVEVDGARVVLGLEDLQAALVPDEPEAWPAFVLALYHGHHEAWARVEIARRRSPEPFPALITALVDSGLGASAARRQAIRVDPANGLLGNWVLGPHEGSRAAWPTPDAGDALRLPRVSPIPVLFMSGDWDTSTPVDNMHAIAPFFPNGRTIVAHREGHNGVAWMTRNHPALFAAVLEFLRSGATAGLPAEISNPPPRFAVPGFAPPRR